MSENPRIEALVEHRKRTILNLQYYEEQLRNEYARLRHIDEQIADERTEK